MYLRAKSCWVKLLFKAPSTNTCVDVLAYYIYYDIRARKFRRKKSKNETTLKMTIYMLRHSWLNSPTNPYLCCLSCYEYHRFQNEWRNKTNSIACKNVIIFDVSLPFYASLPSYTSPSPPSLYFYFHCRILCVQLVHWLRYFILLCACVINVHIKWLYACTVKPRN